MNTDLPLAFKYLPSKPVHFLLHYERIAEVNYECQGLPEIMQPIAKLFLIFFINVVFAYLNAIIRMQSIRFKID